MIRVGVIVNALDMMPDESVIDGELCALDEDGKPSFNLLQNYRSAAAPIVYYAFDLLMLSGKNLMDQPLIKRREVLEQKVLSKLDEPIRLLPHLEASLPDLVPSVKEQ